MRAFVGVGNFYLLPTEGTSEADMPKVLEHFYFTTLKCVAYSNKLHANDLTLTIKPHEHCKYERQRNTRKKSWILLSDINNIKSDMSSTLQIGEKNHSAA